MAFLEIKVNSSYVTHETIAEQTIIVHIKSGSYYDLCPQASEFWNLIASPSGIFLKGSLSLNEQKNVSISVDANAFIENFLITLLAEDLIAVEAVPDSSLHSSTARANFEILKRIGAKELQIRKHTDMEMFLRLDPILLDEAKSYPSTSSE